MHINNLIMYCQCHDENFPRHTQFQQKKLLCNANRFEPYEREYLQRKDFVFDNDGENISDLNWTFGDLTGAYYIWKNTDHEFVGHNQYRRVWSEHVVDVLEENTLYYSAPLLFGNKTCAEQYIECHGEYGLVVLNKIATKKFTQEHVNTIYSINHINACNMFFGHKAVYDKFCEALFDVMFDVYYEAEPILKNVLGYQRRMVAFLAERVMTSLIYNHTYFFGNTRMVPVPIYTI